MSEAGYDYWPRWLIEIGVRTEWQGCIIVLVIYTLAYGCGRLVGSPQRAFNRLRHRYEAIVRKAVYWFDNRFSSYHYGSYSSVLANMKTGYERFLETLSADTRSLLSLQRIMVVYYQHALLMCTMRRYHDVLKDVSTSSQIRNVLKAKNFLQENESLVIESQLSFLEGEIQVCP